MSTSTMFRPPFRVGTGTLPAFACLPMAVDDDAAAVARIIADGSLRAVLQPIFDYRTQTWLGYEGLIRGPAGSRFESPLALLAAARGRDERLALDLACWHTIIREFSRQQLAGLLFLNVSPSSLLQSPLRLAGWAREIRALGGDPARIVIELTENQQIDDFSQFRDVLLDFRRLGFHIAIDDLGEGFSNLRMWSEVHPDFVKIDRHFVQGIADDVLKYHLVRAMHELAEVTGASIIAEGMETDTDFRTIRDLGIACGQGYFIARPEAEPPRRPPRHVLDALRDGEIVVFPNPRAPSGSNPVRQLAVPLCPLTPADDNDHAYARFESDHDLHVLPVVDLEGTPIGMLSRFALIDRFARPFRRELYGKKACTEFMDASPLVIDASVTVEEVGRIISRGEKHRMLDGFIVTETGRYLGVGSSQDLMALITDMQISAARYANPLTALPGAVPLNEHADRLLELRLPFAACYFDINDFKPFNDRFGYRVGDQIIQMLGKLLRDIGETKRDFISHIGGDDFMVLFQSEDWEARCTRALGLFDRQIAHFIPLEDLSLDGYRGTDRKGREVMHPQPTLAIGALRIEPGDCASHHEIAAATANAKRMAKRATGSTLFVERRRPEVPSAA